MAPKHLAASWSAVDRDRMFAAALLGGVALLLCDLRFEHREVLGETWRSWIPLIYAAVTLLGGLVALLRWDGKGRRVPAMLFGAGIAVGLLGFWFHTDGHLVTGLRNVLLICVASPHSATNTSQKLVVRTRSAARGSADSPISLR